MSNIVWQAFGSVAGVVRHEIFAQVDLAGRLIKWGGCGML